MAQDGREATALTDVYSLGIVLYQSVIGDYGRVLASGWERDVEDPLLRADIAACVDGDPARRLSGPEELARRIRALPERRLAMHAARRRRRRFVGGAVAAALLLVALGGWRGLAYFSKLR